MKRSRGAGREGSGNFVYGFNFCVRSQAGNRGVLKFGP